MSLPGVQYDMIRLSGGMDQVTPTLSLPPGVARRAANFECSLNGGYTRISGYERFDGRASPSAARYNVLTCSITGTIDVGNTVTGGTSGATGKVIARSGNDVVVTRETGTFVAGETLSVGSVQATITSIAGAVADGLTDATYKALAADDYRASIAAVPGAGNILGLAFLNGVLYAWRNNVGNTAKNIYRSSGSGWTLVNLNEQVNFSNANVNVNEGDVLTQGAVTATVLRVIVRTGTLASGTNTGTLIISGRAGGNFSAAAATSTGSGALTLSGAQTAVTLAPGGRVETVVANFGGGPTRKRIYGVDGVGPAFEFDGTVLAPITTAMSPDTPTKIAVHVQSLFLAFGYSLQFSALGNPYSWSPVLGAGEIAMNDSITNLIPLPGDQSSGALGVYTKNETSILYGTSSANFRLATFNNGTGAFSYSGQNLDQTYILNDRGVMNLGSSQNFGNFLTAAITMNLRPFIEAHKVYTSASVVNREKGQFRIFFSDNYGLYCTIANGQFVGAMPVQFAHPVIVTCEGENSDGTFASFFGSSNGFVYQMDRGPSFDGQDIPANLNLVYNSVNSPRVRKRFRKASLELTGEFYATFSFGYDLSYRSLEVSQPNDADYSNDLRGAFWDSFTWDNFVWDGTDNTPTEIGLDGTAENMAIRIASVSKLIQPFTVNSVTVHYTPRRGMR